MRKSDTPEPRYARRGRRGRRGRRRRLGRANEAWDGAAGTTLMTAPVRRFPGTGPRGTRRAHARSVTCGAARNASSPGGPGPPPRARARRPQLLAPPAQRGWSPTRPSLAPEALPPMTCTRSVIALLALGAAAAPAQQPDTTLWAHLRYRFVGPEGNRAVAVVGEPGNPLVAYIGAASGGVWRTEDGGVHWRASFDSEPVQAIGALALAPSAHTTLWAGTGETFFIRSTTALGDGVDRTADGGGRWEDMGRDSAGPLARVVIRPPNHNDGLAW